MLRLVVRGFEEESDVKSDIHTVLRLFLAAAATQNYGTHPINIKAAFYKDKIYTDVNKNASLIITDFLAMTKENEQRRTASLCRGWAMLENDYNLICR